MAAKAGDALISEARDVKGVKVLLARLDGADAKALRETMDKVKDKLGSVACGCIAAEVIGREQQRGEKEQQPQNRAKRSAFNHDHFSFSRACPKSEAAGPPRQAPGPATREAPSAEASDAQVYWSE